MANYNGQVVLTNGKKDYIKIDDEYKVVNITDKKYYKYINISDNTDIVYAHTDTLYEIYNYKVDGGYFKSKALAGYKYWNDESDYIFITTNYPAVTRYLVDTKYYSYKDIIYKYFSDEEDFTYDKSVSYSYAYLINDTYYSTKTSVNLYYNSDTVFTYSPSSISVYKLSYYTLGEEHYRYKVSGFYKYDNGADDTIYSKTSVTKTSQGYLIDAKYYQNKTSGYYGYNNYSSSAEAKNIDVFTLNSVSAVEGYLIGDILYINRSDTQYYRYYNDVEGDFTKENYYSDISKPLVAVYLVNGKVYTNREHFQYYYSNSADDYAVSDTNVNARSYYAVDFNSAISYYQNKSGSSYLKFYNDETDFIYSISSYDTNIFYKIGNEFYQRYNAIFGEYNKNYYQILNGYLYVNGDDVLLCEYNTYYKPKEFKLNSAIYIESKVLFGNFTILGYSTSEPVYKIKFQNDDNYYLVVGLR